MHDAAFPLQPLDGGRACLLRVRAQPGASRTGRASAWNDRLKLSLAAPPEDGRANRELVAWLRAELGVAASELELVAGHAERNKSVRIAQPFAMIEPHVRAWLAGPDARERR
ncbi:MAG: DUF167 domain-containing protein [Planctomycetota bacterium]|nr:MAG: DUF167 domain-containing protein [Planctomycetota bacterium]